MRCCELVTSSYRTALSFDDLFRKRFLRNIGNSSRLIGEPAVNSEQAYIENFLRVFFDLVENSCFMEDFLLCDGNQLLSNKYKVIRDRRFTEFFNVMVQTLKEFHGEGWTNAHEKAWCGFKEEVLMMRNLRLLQDKKKPCNRLGHNNKSQLPKNRRLQKDIV